MPNNPIEDYDSNCAQQFQDLEDVFNEALKKDCVAIESVGVQLCQV